MEDESSWLLSGDNDAAVYGRSRVRHAGDDDAGKAGNDYTRQAIKVIGGLFGIRSGFRCIGARVCGSLVNPAITIPAFANVVPNSKVAAMRLVAK